MEPAATKVRMPGILAQSKPDMTVDRIHDSEHFALTLAVIQAGGSVMGLAVPRDNVLQRAAMSMVFGHGRLARWRLPPWYTPLWWMISALLTWRTSRYTVALVLQSECRMGRTRGSFLTFRCGVLDGGLQSRSVRTAAFYHPCAGHFVFAQSGLYLLRSFHQQPVFASDPFRPQMGPI